MQRGAGRGYHSRTDLDTYPDSYYCTADRDSHAQADPDTYLNSGCDAHRDRHTRTDLSPHSDRGAGRLLACKQ